MEFMYYNDSSQPEFKNPSDLEMKIAKKHGNFYFISIYTF